MKIRSGFLAIACVLAACPPAWAEQRTLEEAWALAYQNNPSLEAERARLRALDEKVSQALSNWRPSVDANANDGKVFQYSPQNQRISAGNYESKTRGYGLQATQPIFRGFRTLSETKSAEKQVMAGRANLENAEQQLLLDVATSFLDIIRDESIIASENENEAVLQDKLKETIVRARVGDLTQTDVRQAESRLARAQVDRMQTENALTADRTAYARLVGEMPEALEKPDPVLDHPQNVEEAVNLAETKNPAVIAGQYAVESADADIDLNKGSLLPEVNVVGSTSHNTDQSSVLPGRVVSDQIMVQMTIPLYRSGADYSRIRAAQETSVQRSMELEETRHRAHETANNSWQTLQIAGSAMKADKTEIDAAAEALKGVKVESKIGTRTTLDVLNAQQELLDAEIGMARAEHDKILAIMQIKAAVGDLTVDHLDLPIVPYDPQHHYDDARSTWAGWENEDYTYSGQVKSLTQ